ncbi:MAG: flagellar hook-basal body complex protein FliE [Bosea sp. (in: a-proteobacteria)]
MPTSSFAAGAYKSAQMLASTGLKPNMAAPDASKMLGGNDFAQLVSDAVNFAQKAGAKADNQAAAVATGRADVIDVVTAVAESEAAIETLVAVRDRVIAAYEEIMRMPI